MEIQMNTSYVDHTFTWVFFILALACFALAGISALWWKLAADNKRNRKKASAYEAAEVLGIVGGIGFLVIAGFVWLFLEMSAAEAPRDEAISQIEQTYGFTLDREQRSAINEALTGSYVDPIGDDSSAGSSSSYGYGANASRRASRIDPYQEPVSLGDVWIERDDGSLVKGTFSFMLKKTDDDNVIVFELVMPGETADTIQRISPEEVREHANSIQLNGDVSQLFEKADPDETD